MFGSEILDVTIGLIFIYLLLSLICLAVVEIIEAWLKRRATDLELGLRELLADSSGANLVKDLYAHPLVHGLFKGVYNPTNKRPSRRFFRPILPSYIPARTFALALMDTILPATPTAASGALGAAPAQPLTPVKPLQPLRDAVVMMQNDTVKRALLTLVDAAGDDAAKARENIEAWYDSAMDRVAGWYKRQTQVVLLVLGFLVAVIANVDTVSLAQSLSNDEALRGSLVRVTEGYIKDLRQSPCGEAGRATPSCVELERQLSSDVDRLRQLGLPLGWQLNNSRMFPGNDPGAWALKVAGWLLTAVAVSLGAPFWFDLLNKFMVVRSTVKPREKSPDEPPVDG